MRASTLGKVLGAPGLVILLSAPFTYFVSSGSVWATALKVIVGGFLVGAFFATNFGELGQLTSSRAALFYGSTVALVVLLLVALGSLNYIVGKRGKSWDLTRRKIYTLAPQTQGVLAGLAEPVRVLVFMTPGVPASEGVDALLQRYHRQRPDHFTFAFKDPRKSPELNNRYHVNEGQTTLVLLRGEGATEAQTSIHLAMGQELSEQDLTNALLKLSQVGTQKVYVLAGHGEWPLEKDGADSPSLGELARSMQQEGYAPVTLNLAGRAEVPKDAAVVVIAGARAQVSAPEEAVLAAYLEQGGRLMVFAEAQQDGGLKQLLARYGVEIDPGIIADDHFAVETPYKVLSAFYSDHPLARELKRLQLNIQMPTARGLTVLKQGALEGVTVEPVLTTSPFAWEEGTLTAEPSRSDGEKTGSIPLVVASSRKIAAGRDRRFEEARLVVLGDSELLVDANWGYEPDRNLVMNALAWATNQTVNMTIRPPDRDISTLDLDGPTLRKIRFVSLDLLPLTLLGIGLAVWMRRRDQ